jgi:hypothetical protein
MAALAGIQDGLIAYRFGQRRRERTKRNAGGLTE